VFVRNTMPPNAPLWFYYFYLLPWRMTLTFHHSKCAAPWDAHSCQIWSCYLQYCKSYDKTLRFLKVLNRQTDRMKDRPKTIYPLFFKRRHKNCLSTIMSNFQIDPCTKLSRVLIVVPIYRHTSSSPSQILACSLRSLRGIIVQHRIHSSWIPVSSYKEKKIKYILTTT
jgi:hypothetical protein